MRLEILAVGRLKAGPEQELYNRYADRVSKSGKQLHFDGIYLHEIAESRLQDTNSRKEDEAQQLLAKVSSDARIIVLDERGKDSSSIQFSEILSREQGEGTSTLAFAIGGPDGHGEAMKARACSSIRFGSVTWPHQLARVMLTEQIYRAVTILSGHPYHRE